MGTARKPLATCQDDLRLLHDIEFLGSVGWRLLGLEYPDTSPWWKRLRQNKPLPYEARQTLKMLLDPIGAIGAEFDRPTVPVNTIGFDRHEVARKPDGDLTFINVPGHGVGMEADPPPGVVAQRRGQIITLENEHLRAQFSPAGQLLSLYAKDAERESLSAPATLLIDNNPWKASVANIASEPLRAQARFGSTALTLTVTLDAASRRLEFSADGPTLQMNLPALVDSPRATYAEPLSFTEWPVDGASHDAHGWLDLSEYGFGLSIVSPQTFLAAVKQNILQAQAQKWAIIPHLDGWREAGIIEEAGKFGRPVLWGKQWADSGFYIRAEDPNLVIDTIKMAQNGRGIIVRIYECHGGRGTARLHTGLVRRGAWFVDAREQKLAKAPLDEGTLVIPYTPHQIIHLRLD